MSKKAKTIISIMKRPANWKPVPDDEQDEVSDEVKPVKRAKSTATSHKRPTGTSKKDQAIDLYGEWMLGTVHPARKHVVAMFQDQLGMTAAGASTYAAMCKKHFSNSSVDKVSQ